MTTPDHLRQDERIAEARTPARPVGAEATERLDWNAPLDAVARRRDREERERLLAARDALASTPRDVPSVAPREEGTRERLEESVAEFLAAEDAVDREAERAGGTPGWSSGPVVRRVKAVERLRAALLASPARVEREPRECGYCGHTCAAPAASPEGEEDRSRCVRCGRDLTSGRYYITESGTECREGDCAPVGEDGTARVGDALAEIHDAFYRVTVQQRDSAWREIERLRERLRLAEQERDAAVRTADALIATTEAAEAALQQAREEARTLQQIVHGHQDSQGFPDRPRGSHAMWTVRNEVAWEIRDRVRALSAIPEAPITEEVG